MGLADFSAAEPGARSQGTLLGRLQDDLAADQGPRPDPERLPLRPDDRSVQVHAAHGPDRQVEVLREVLVGLLEDDPTLEPRDIVVMCPDIERFAPLIAAAFGLDTDEQVAEHPGHRLRVRLADRSLRQLNPLLAVLSRVLELATGRVTASDVVDLAAMPPVGRRLGFGPDDGERLADLVAQSGVRWGFDAPHRQPYGMDDFAQNTWAAGLDRLLLGVAMDEQDDHAIGTALPLDDVDSGDVELVGRLAELVARLRTAADACRSDRPLSGWVALAKEVISSLTAVGGNDEWQLAHAHRELSRLAEALDPDSDPELSLAEVRSLLADAFTGRASRTNFRTGTLTMCTMHPMRSVPHRVVCLLGVDDGVFPRRSGVDGDDILAVDPWVGDRDPRSEDRQLLLDAVLAAEERLVVVYGGADPRTGADRPPAVPIGELLDALDLTARTADGRRVREHVTVRHRLQPFDVDNFRPAALAPGRFSFDVGAARGAIAAGRPRAVPRDPYRVGVLAEPAPRSTVELTELTRFFDHPARALLRSRAGLVAGWDDPPVSDELPVELDGLDAWAVGQRMLRQHLAGADLARLAAAEWRRGTLPPRSFGRRSLDPVLDRVRQVADAARAFSEGPASARDVTAQVGEVLVTGTLAPVYGTRLVTVGYSRLAAKHRLAGWLTLLALTVAHPDEAWEVVTVGRGGSSVLGPVPAEFAGLVLGDLLQIFTTGQREIVPFSPNTGADYAGHRSRDRSLAVFRDALSTTWSYECDTTWQRVFGGTALDLLLEEPSRTAEERGVLAEPSRFGTLARRVFHPMLGAEQLR
jgi:exodeoxyribonuclease V gamma subunit